MKQKLSFKEYIYVASILFGMFFGAGNLIFPVYMGQVAGRNMWAAVLGFLITGVGLPLLGVAALGISRSNGLQEMAGRVSPRPLSDHRAVFRHSPVRNDFLHRGSGADPAPR